MKSFYGNGTPAPLLLFVWVSALCVALNQPYTPRFICKLQQFAQLCDVHKYFTPRLLYSRIVFTRCLYFLCLGF